MRPVSPTIAISGLGFSPRVIKIGLEENSFEHQRFHAISTHVFSTEQEGIIPDLTEFVGKSLKCTLRDLSGDSPAAASGSLLFDGIVSHTAVSYNSAGLFLEISGSSGSSQMDCVPRTKIFQELLLSELIDRILAESRGKAIRTTDIKLGSLGNKKISFAAQWGETDWVFLRRVCRKFGLIMVARNRKIYIHSTNPFDSFSGMETPEDLELGKNLDALRLGIGESPITVKASAYQPFGPQGLDPGKGDSQETVKTWLGPNQPPIISHVMAQKGSSGSSDESSGEGMVVESDSHYSQQEFDAIAGRYAAYKAASIVLGSGVSDHLGLGVGKSVQIKPIKNRTPEAGNWSLPALEGGHFLLDQAIHTVEGGVYHIEFSLRAAGLPRMLDPVRIQNDPVLRLAYATVVSSFDKSNIGRVTIQLSAFGDEGLVEDIPVRCLFEGSGDGHGTLNLPEIGDEVLLVVDPRTFLAPVCMGSLYNGANKTLVANLPAHAEIDAASFTDNNIKYYLSKAGTAVIHDTTAGKARLILATPSLSVVMSEVDGLNMLVRGNGGDCQIAGNMDGDITIKAKNIKLEAEQEIEIKSGTDCKIDSGANAKIKAGQNWEIEAGMKAAAKASMGMELKGGLTMKLQAVKIDLN